MARKSEEAPYVAILVAMLVCYAVVTLATLRILNGSPGSAWNPDSSAWFCGLFLLGTSAVGLFADWILDTSTIGGTNHWLFYIVDGVAIAALFSLDLALASVAYRRVARV
jgi:hypothetical protein